MAFLCKTIIYLMPLVFAAHNNLVITCPTATRAYECAGRQPQVREFSMKTELIFMCMALLAASER